MPKRSSKPQSPPDHQPTSSKDVDEVLTDSEQVNKTPLEVPKNPAAVALGRLGGLKGGAARAKKLTKAKRSEIAKKAAQARWSQKEK